jgi:hypothetical protein
MSATGSIYSFISSIDCDPASESQTDFALVCYILCLVIYRPSIDDNVLPMARLGTKSPEASTACDLNRGKYVDLITSLY